MGKKFIIFSVAALIIVVVACVVVLSLDSTPPQDSDLIFNYTQVLPEDNAFLELTTEAVVSEVGADAAADVLVTWDKEKAAEIVDMESVALEAWQDALKKPRLQVPEIASFDTSLYYLSPWRSLARLASVKARLLAEQGKVDEALDLSIDIIRFAQMQERSDGALINHLVAVAVKSIGMIQLHHILLNYDVSTEKLRATTALLADMVCDRERYKDAYRIEYTMAKKVVADIAAGRQGTGDLLAIGVGRLEKFQSVPFIFKENETLALFSAAYVTYIEDIDRPFHNREEVTVRPPSKRDYVSGNILGVILYNMLFPVLNRAIEKVDRCDAQLEMLRVHLAIKAFRNDHEGQWPRSLKELVPTYISEVPVDRFSPKQATLNYSPDKPIIYSVGRDGVDAGGASSTELADGPEKPSLWKMDDPTLLLERVAD